MSSTYPTGRSPDSSPGTGVGDGSVLNHVPLKCGMCKFTTSSLPDLIEHTSSHPLVTHPFECTSCSRSFAEYMELQDHPCGDKQFVFRLNNVASENDVETGNSRSQPKMAVNSTGVKSPQKRVNSTIVRNRVYVPTIEVKKQKVNQTQIDRSGTELKDGGLPCVSTRTLRERKIKKKRGSDEDDQEIHTQKTQSSRQKKKDKKSRVKSELKQYIQQSDGEFMFCRYCTFKSVYPGNLRSHIKKHLEVGRKHFYCMMCQSQFLTKHQLELHVCNENTTSQLSTTSQLVVYKQNRVILNKARKTAAADNNNEFLFKCRLCGFSNKAKSSVKRHIYRHRCENCQDVLPTVAKRTTHMNRCKKGIIPYSSGEQQVATSTGTMITFNRNSPKTLVAVECQTCKLCFLQMAQYNTHRCYSNDTLKPLTGKTKQKVLHNTTHKNNTIKRSIPSSPISRLDCYDKKIQMYTCKYCIFTNLNAVYLMHHLKRHNKSEPLLKETPELQAKRLEFVQQKERERSKPRMEGWDDEAMLYVCDECDYTTRTAIALYNHRRYHLHQRMEQEVQYEELQEEESVNVSVDDEDSPSGRATHKTTLGHPAVGTTMYQCGQCEFRTQRQWDLAAHRGLHTGQRPLKCAWCNIGFADGFHLRIHILKVHGAKLPNNPAQIANQNEVGTTSGDPGLNEAEEACPHPGCSFRSSSATAMTRHFNMHIKSQTVTSRESYSAADSDILLNLINPHFSPATRSVNMSQMNPTCSNTMSRYGNTAHDNLANPCSKAENYPPSNATTRVGFVAKDNLSNVIMKTGNAAQNNLINVQSTATDKLAHTTPQRLGAAKRLTFADEPTRDTSVVQTSPDEAQTEKVYQAIRSSPVCMANSAYTQLKPFRGHSIKHILGPDANGAHSRYPQEHAFRPQANIEFGSYVNTRPGLIRPSRNIDRGAACWYETGESEKAATPSSRSSPMVQSDTSEDVVVIEDDVSMLQQEQAEATVTQFHDTADKVKDSTKDDQASISTIPSFLPQRPNGGPHSQQINAESIQRLNTNPHLQPTLPDVNLHLHHISRQQHPQTNRDYQIVPVDAGAQQQFNTVWRRPSHSGSASLQLPSTETQLQPIVESPGTAGFVNSRRPHLAIPVPHLAIPVPLRPVAVTANSLRPALSDHAPPGESSYPALHRCAFCAVHFEDFRVFMRHLSQHHPEDPWTCTICWRSFQNAASFTDHHLGTSLRDHH